MNDYIKIDHTLVEYIDAMVQAIAAYADTDTLRLLAGCQQCRNRVLYLLDTRSDMVPRNMMAHSIMNRRLMSLKEDHRVHIPDSIDGPSTEPPVIRTTIS
jgi:hypothetical protein